MIKNKKVQYTVNSWVKHLEDKPSNIFIASQEGKKAYNFIENAIKNFYNKVNTNEEKEINISIKKKGKVR